MKPAALVQAWLDTLRPEQQLAAIALNDAVLAAEPDLARTIKWGNLVFVHLGKNALALTMHKDHANLQLFNGAALAAAFPSLEGSGKSLRHLKFRYAQPIDADLVQAAVRASIALMSRGAA